MGRCLIVSDSGHWFGFAEGLSQRFKDLADFDVLHSTDFLRTLSPSIFSKDRMEQVDVGDRETAEYLAVKYSLIVSLHCQQIFHAYLVKNTVCVNLHPGLLPHGRGWNPYVWALNDGTAAGATLHLMDEKVDHGRLLAVQCVKVEPTDSCDTVYQGVRMAEEALITEWLPKLIEGSRPEGYAQFKNPPRAHTKQDYLDLCDLDLDDGLSRMTGRALIRRLRALTYEGQHNAYFRDNQGKKVHVAITLRRDV